MGPALLFLHGFPGTWTDNGPVYELLVPDYHVVAHTQGVGPIRMAGFLFGLAVDRRFPRLHPGHNRNAGAGRRSFGRLVVWTGGRQQ